MRCGCPGQESRPLLQDQPRQDTRPTVSQSPKWGVCCRKEDLSHDTKVKEEGFGGHSAPLILTEAAGRRGLLLHCSPEIRLLQPMRSGVLTALNAFMSFFSKSPKKYRLKDS